ncbi:hypothetical protein G5V59_27365 [Nocardioides sp. W3-2-3]|uniref:hypothetical protein n=1 Tax=Nocardioides convexus TaxID=2712224 RepID=UPI00241847D3|nr:hypothetical protein [Nocardioides convexus]NHA02102.1 hypothetical protein [Nocardioides convexus]
MTFRGNTTIDAPAWKPTKRGVYVVQVSVPGTETHHEREDALWRLLRLRPHQVTATPAAWALPLGRRRHADASVIRGCNSYVPQD